MDTSDSVAMTIAGPPRAADPSSSSLRLPSEVGPELASLMAARVGLLDEGESVYATREMVKGAELRLGARGSAATVSAPSAHPSAHRNLLVAAARIEQLERELVETQRAMESEK